MALHRSRHETGIGATLFVEHYWAPGRTTP
jgi:hypothetical protein